MGKYRSVFDGYLTDECAKCEFWSDRAVGPDWMLGCNYIGPIMNCDAFRKMFEEDARREREEKNEEIEQ